MDKKSITHSLKMIRLFRPAFGLITESVEEYIADYLNYYQLNSACCKHTYGYIKVRNEQLFVQRFEPEEVKGTILLLHGYLDHAGSLSKMIHFLVENGYAVICFDLLGHGLSSGKRAAVQLFTDYTDLFAVIYKNMLINERKPIHFIAHSTGASIGLDFIDHHAHSFNKMILISPLFCPHLWRISKIALLLAKPYVSQIKRNFTRNSGDDAYLQFTYEDPLQEKVLPFDWLFALNESIRKRNNLELVKSSTRFLMIQGDLDRTINTKFGFKWAKAHYPNSSIVLMKGGRHQLLNEEPIIRNQTFTIIKKYLEEKASH